MPTGDFTPSIWKRMLVDEPAELWRRAQWHRPTPAGQLHEPSPAVRRTRERSARRLRRRILLASWWWRVRAPLRRWGGCPEREE